jgi:uncharacterized membrane protein
MNREVVVVEILQALIGRYGLLATIPLASVISAAVYTRKLTSVEFSKRT